MKILLNYNFEFVQDIIPKLDCNGNIKELFPQSRYIKKENSQLGKYGNGAFCHFSIDNKWKAISGVYVFYIENNLVYIGQTINFAQRFNNGYGNISPRNCYNGGQPTNCKMNKVVLTSIKDEKKVSLYFYITDNHDKIEKELIAHYNPRFNETFKNNQVIILNSKQADNVYEHRNKQVNTKNPPISEVRNYIQKLIFNAKQSGKNELVLSSGKIHKDLNMNNALPTVCSAMKTLNGEYEYVFLEQPPKGKGTRLILRYKF